MASYDTMFILNFMTVCQVVQKILGEVQTYKQMDRHTHTHMCIMIM